MMKVSLRTVAAVCALTLLVTADGCRRHRKTKSAPNTTKYADNLQKIVAKTQLPKEMLDAKELTSLRWPNFSDYQPIVAQFYDDRNYEVAWTRDGAPTASTNAMTVNVMRFISDLRIGRVNPSHFNFDINVQDKKYDLAEFVSDNAVDATDVPGLIARAEPDSEQYRKTEEALAHYLELAKQQEQAGAEPLPMVEKAVSVGGSYPAAAQLLTRLQLEGDVDGGASESAKTTVFDAELSDGVKSYQHRHGIGEDGRLTPQTTKSLNVPLTERVTQLQNSLERWRWLPDPYVNPRLLVNLPEFVLRGYTPEHKLDFTMKVVVGKVVGEHQTPVFTHMMKYLVFRPYWNVPVDIARKELVPHIVTNQGYLATKNFEVTNGKGVVLTSYTAKQVSQGGVMVRERPGPKNSLGLVKFMFPNQYDIYLHSTPAVSLFDRTRRDFSHGCIRVQKPEDLAAWVLQGQGDWDLEKVQEAMNGGPDNHAVSLKTPLPIVIFYATALVEEDGHVHFFDDIYGYDAEMQKVLAKGPPYPPRGGYPRISCFDSMTCNLRCLQNRHSKWVTGKIVFLKELRENLRLKRESPGRWTGAFFNSISIIAGWRNSCAIVSA